VTTQAQTTGSMRTNLEHLKRHIQYPADRKALVTACNNMSDVPEGDKRWFEQNLPEGTYRTPEDVVKAVMAKV
jgi:hypothetical protein